MKTWTVQETQDWYKKYYVDQTDQDKPFVSPLYYRGSNDTHHFFGARSMDEAFFIKIKVTDLSLIDVRPKWKTADKSESAGSFGYYAVDPLQNFKRVSRSQ